MTTDPDPLQRLRRDVQYLMDRTAILDCIAANARGCDRYDVDLLTGTYHDDGAHETGNRVTPGPEYAEWMNGVHARTAQNHLHNVTTHSCEIDGDVAHCDSYVMVSMLSPDGRSATVLNGRYLDRLERRDGRWRIVVRRTTVELVLRADASMLQHPRFVEQGYLRGAHDTTDLSYRRPLDLDTPAPARW